jgi:hypothetical protein
VQINVVLVDPLEATKAGNVQADIQKKLDGYFQEVVKVANSAKPKSPFSVSVAWSATKPAPSDTDLLIYFVPQECSVVGKFSGKDFDPSARSHWGYTYFSYDTDSKGVRTSTAASEVYTKNLDAGVLAALAFHESMHHKLLLGGEPAKGAANLHTHGGLAQASIDESTAFTQQNKAEMAGALSTKITQWTAGYDKLVAAKFNRDHGDPIWYKFS